MPFFCVNMKKIVTLILVFLFTTVSVFATEVRRDTTLTATVQFIVNTNTVVKGDPGYALYHNTLIPFMKEHMESLERVEFVGSASPEGPDELNKKLSRIRAEVLSDELDIPSNKKYVQYVGENYDLLLTLIKDESQRDTLKSIIDSGFNVKRRIHKLAFYKEHLDQIYPLTRCVEIKMHFRGYEILPCRIDTVCVRDTVYLKDTLYFSELDTIYIREKLERYPILALKTNLASDVILAPNVQAELYTHIWGLSLEFDYTCPWYYSDDVYMYYQLLDGRAGIRKYFNNKYTGHYLGVYGHTFIYDFAINKDKGWQGEGHGAGLSYGYVFQNKKHPRIKFEPYVRVGWFYTRFDKYHASQPFDGKYYYDWYGRKSDFVPRRFEMNYFGPTEIGFTFTFDLICGYKKYEEVE